MGDHFPDFHHHGKRIDALENNIRVLLETAKQDEKRIVMLGARVAALEEAIKVNETYRLDFHIAHRRARGQDNIG